MGPGAVAVLFHPRLAAARVLAERVCEALKVQGRECWTASAWDAAVPDQLVRALLTVCIGGDGTMLRAARAAIPHTTPVLGVNMGRLGFLSELHPDEAIDRIHDVIAGAGRIEERAMLVAEVTGGDGKPVGTLGRQYALNDVVVARSGGRPVDIDVLIDGAPVEVVRADGMVVATATGSTGYNLSAGGPVLYPEDPNLVLTPVAAHLSRVRPFVLPPDAHIELRVYTEMQAMVSFDGQIDYPLESGASVSVRRSEHVARFIRLGPPSDFYRNVTKLLDAKQRAERHEGGGDLHRR